MAVLESGSKRCFLGADSLIGREGSATLRLDDESVSWRHASLRWTGQVWELQDLGSRNGTFLNGQRVSAGARAVLRVGSQLRFGNARDLWHLVNVDPPTTCLVDLLTGERVYATDDLIALPQVGDPQLFISRQATGDWVAELEARAWTISPMELISLGSRQYRFEPAGPVYATISGRADLPAVSTLALEFVVSRHEEFSAVTIVHGERRIPLRPRAHTYMLATLARLRIQDQANPALPSSSHGWVDQERLLDMLNTNATQLAVDIYRARKQFSDAGIAEAAHLVERRTTSHELRIGVSTLKVVNE